MQVHLKHSEEKQGLIFKKTVYNLQCNIDYADEERELLEQSNILEHLIVEYAHGVGGGKREYTVRDTLDPDGRIFCVKTEAERTAIDQKLASSFKILQDRVSKIAVEHGNNAA